jgi:membrane-bound lytic murein transglycosylase D
MKLIRTTFLLLCSVSLASGALAQSPVSRGATADVATQALPCAAVPAAALVPPPEATAAAQEPSVREVVAFDASTPDEPAVAEEIEQESAEMEDLRRAEEASKVQDASGSGRRAGGSAEGLGLESPIRDRVGGALGRDAAPRDETGGRIALLPELDHDLAALQAEYDIPIDVNEAVVAYIRFFQAPSVRAHFVKWLGRSSRYMERYRAILREEGLPEDTVFLAMIESGFGNFAYSRAKASGPWQFIPATGKHYGLQQDFWVDERRDPEQSARAAARFLKALHDQTGDWRLAWAGYNAGAGRIFAARKKGYEDFWEMAAVPGRKVLRAETKGYVPKLMAAAIITKHQEAFGFRPEEIERQAWPEYEEVEVPHATLLSVLARAAGVGEKDLLDLNPELRRACTPPRPYKLKIPSAAGETFAASWPAIRSKVRMTFAGHVVRRGDTLARVARRYGVPVQGIVEMNGLKGVNRLRPGRELLIPRPVSSGVAVAAARTSEQPHRSANPVRVALAPDAVDEVVTPQKEAPVKAASPVKAVAVASVSASAEKASRTTLRVRTGDTLWSIAQRFGVELGDLCRWNGIKNPSRHKLLAGAMLVLYPGRG